MTSNFTRSSKEGMWFLPQQTEKRRNAATVGNVTLAASSADVGQRSRGREGAWPEPSLSITARMMKAGGEPQRGVCKRLRAAATCTWAHAGRKQGSL